jgi:nitrite reductase (NO-forming)
MVIQTEPVLPASNSRTSPYVSNWPRAAKSGVRAAFGVIWAVDAMLKWQPAFVDHFAGYVQNASHGQPPWLGPWFDIWLALITPHVTVFAFATRLIETAIALGLLLGFARKVTYIVGVVFSLLIWSTAEGFGGPYTAGATNIGPALLYVLVFGALILFNWRDGPTPYSLDYYLERRWPSWQRVAEWAHVAHPLPDLPRLSWRAQGYAIVAIIATLAVLFASFQSALGAKTATPGNAAAAVSPLTLAAPGAIPTARDATLPPLIGTGDEVALTIEATDTNVAIANGVQYQAWTFGGTVPGPVFHVRQGQKVDVTFVNKGMMQHSIDFHAAETPPNVAYKSIDPGQSLQFSFVANTPGAFVYHCGTPPVLGHMANGMFGAIIVDPTQPLPQAAASYVLVQSEWYTAQAHDKLMTADYDKMQALAPDEVVFNGVAYQYKDHPLAVKAGQRVRLYVVDAGPSLPSAFHVIGAMFEKVYQDADPKNALSGVSTFTIAPGQGVIVDLTIPAPGHYAFVDHSMRNMMVGAAGVLDVTP